MSYPPLEPGDRYLSDEYSYSIVYYVLLASVS